MRALARDPSLQSKFVFAMLDAHDFAEHMADTYHIEPSTNSPRLLVLWKGEYARTFYVDQPGELALIPTLSLRASQCRLV